MALLPTASTAGEAVAHAASTCSDYPNQSAAQVAADPRDADGDGIYCEDLVEPFAQLVALFRRLPSPHEALNRSGSQHRDETDANDHHHHGDAPAGC